MVKFFRNIQAVVDGVGMYRVVTLGLWVLVTCSVIAGFFGFIAYGGMVQLQAVASGVFLALVLNIVLAKVRNVSANHESAVITALILFFLTIPAATFLDNWPLWAAIAIAMLSKYLIVYRGQHIFNPAAFGALTLSLSGIYEMSWWIANPVLFVPLVLAGVAVTLKVRKVGLVLSCIAAAFVIYMFESVWMYSLPAWSSFTVFWLSWPTLFLAFFMLTEPFTLPPSKRQQMFYGGFVGGLSNTSLLLPLVVMSPELALVIGNLAVYPWRIRRKLVLELKEKKVIATDTFEYVFIKPKGFTYKAGQYLEWMLPHNKRDSRGPRRYFTIASAPSEPVVRLACKHVPEGSSYKQALINLKPGDNVIASQLAGDFTLPKDTNKKLGFIAGGIGITPFRSHVAHMLETKKQYDTTLYYCCKTTTELAYAEFFTGMAAKLPLQYTEVIAKEPVVEPREAGFVTADMLARLTPDYLERHWFISGPPPMVNAYKTLLQKAGVPKRQIKTDFFPGLA